MELPSAQRSLTAGDAHGAFSFADGVTAAAWCRLFAEAYAAAPADWDGLRAGAGAPARPATRRCLAIVHGRRHLFVYEPRRGRTHDVALPFRVARAFALRCGLLLQRDCADRAGGGGAGDAPAPRGWPVWFTLFHALEEPVPVGCVPSAASLVATY